METFLEQIGSVSPFAIVAKGAVMIGASALAVLALRRRSAALRHLVLAGGFCASLALPVFSAALPTWSPSNGTPALEANRALADEQQTLNRGAALGANVSEPVPGGRAAGSASMDWPRVGRWIWALGACYLAVRLAVGSALLRDIGRRAAAPVDVRARELLRSCQDLARVRRKVALKVSERDIGPLTYGLGRPVIVLPAAALDWPSERWRAVLLHELAHVKRGDPWWHALAQLACAVHWLNPLAWIAARMLADEREQACDNAVTRLGLRAADYAEHLLALAGPERRMAGGVSASVGMARGAGLERRVERLFQERANREPVSTRSAFLVFFLTAALCAPLAMLGADARATGGPQVLTLDQHGAGMDATGDLAIPGETAPGLGNEARVFGVEGRRVWAEDPRRGVKLWEAILPYQAVDDPELVDDAWVQVKTEEGYVCFDAETGEKVWPKADGDDSPPQKRSSRRSTRDALGRASETSGDRADGEGSDEVFLKAFALRNVAVDDMADLLNRAIEGSFEARSVQATNTLICSGDRSEMDLAERLVSGLDRPGQAKAGGESGLPAGAPHTRDPEVVIFNGSETEAPERGLRIRVAEIGGLRATEGMAIEAAVTGDRFEGVTLVVSRDAAFSEVAALSRKLRAAGVQSVSVRTENE